MRKIATGIILLGIALGSIALLTGCGNSDGSKTYENQAYGGTTYFNHTCYEVDGADYTKIPFKEYKKESYLTFIVNGIILNKDNILGYHEDKICKVLYIKYAHTATQYQITKYVNIPYEVSYIAIGARE